jgi:hypothetical protein
VAKIGLKIHFALPMSEAFIYSLTEAFFSTENAFHLFLFSGVRFLSFACGEVFDKSKSPNFREERE